MTATSSERSLESSAAHLAGSFLQPEVCPTRLGDCRSAGIPGYGKKSTISPALIRRWHACQNSGSSSSAWWRRKSSLRLRVAEEEGRELFREDVVSCRRDTRARPRARLRDSAAAGCAGS